MSDNVTLARESDPAVPPYDYNPSAWSQRIPICLVAFVAAGISVHLSLYQWGLIDSVFDPVFGDGSAKVLKSDTAKTMYSILGIHDASLGVLAYLGDAILGFAGSTRRWQYRPWLVILFGIDVIPLGIVSVVLVLCQAFVVGSWCFLCLVTASLSLLLVYWAWDEVRVSLTYLKIVWTEHQDKGLLWQAFWGLQNEQLDAAAEKLLSREVK
ncbi:vitamin K epoxide reductase family protein [Allorhodopirellula heiligendammensis]|uniref:Vitamin K epoxide reductase family protein n=1 Tax=Allorhodopirellula heiligendammensis TaxID=2714739 RepID=A0A5C6C0Z8_9BACT|nr:vitamin K epoxide reductase family protein [Allorhodopirellula heiligendammensis]TWU16854.1 Vitamin K epoxide reductase family protein [Allorhodopirellula heiligendammensis]